MSTNEDQAISSEGIPSSPDLSNSLGAPHAGGDHPSGVGQGQALRDVEGSDSSGQDRGDSSKAGDHLRKRHREGVPTPNDVGEIEEALLEAFKQGSPETAYALTRELVDLALSSVVEASKTRFALHFGSTRCTNCEGLKVGPGVVATCFQVSQCYFKNFKQGDLTPKQERLLRILG